MIPEQDLEMREALDACLAEHLNPTPFAIEFERRAGVYPSELHLVAIRAKREEDARCLDVFTKPCKDIPCPTPG